MNKILLEIGPDNRDDHQNLAFQGTATQSSIHLDMLAQYAIDGVRYGPDPTASPYCSVTDYDIDPWWGLDLLDTYSIRTVIITTDGSSLDLASGAEIRIGNSLENNGNNNPM
ncbi:Fucolectin-5 Precursor [Triplophysa tibetana]|uniref:Fucolectin-5 n=1 Tax=Triplophysa tibetana TaxID=1572043 RepID=A0A5A9PNR3_9TELE|nr:Fucolectin-5 Precursor [Triplophysa tibetana]